MAKATPTVIVAGRAGGTVTVIKSRDLSISFSVVVPNSMSLGIVKQNPVIPMRAIAPTKYKESL